MANMNRVFLIGNIVTDPELKRLSSGVAVCDLRLAVSDNYKNKEGELVESTCFVDVIVWDKQAENCEKYLSKGSPIMVDGKLKLDTWETDEGQKRSKIRVRAFRVQFLGRPKDRGDSEQKPDNVDAEEKEVEAGMPF